MTMTSRRAFSLFSALFSTPTASSSNPSTRQLKDMAVKEFVTVGIFYHWRGTPFTQIRHRLSLALALAANDRRK